MGSDLFFQHFKELLEASTDPFFGYFISKADARRLSACIEFDARMTDALVDSLEKITGDNHPTAVFLKMQLIVAALQRNEVIVDLVSAKVSPFIENFINTFRRGVRFTYLTQVLEAATILEIYDVKYSWKHEAINLGLRAIRSNGTGEMLDKVGMQFLAALIDSGSINEAHLLLPSLVEALIANSVLLIERTELIASMREMAFLEVAKPVGYKRTEPEIFDAVRERAKVQSNDFSLISKAKKWNNMKLRLIILKLLVESNVGRFAPLILEDPEAHLGYCVVTYAHLSEEAAQTYKKEWIERLGDRRFCFPTDFKLFLVKCGPFTIAEFEKMFNIMMERYTVSPRFLESLLDSCPAWAITKVPDKPVLPYVRRMLRSNNNFIQVDAIRFMARHAPQCALEEITLIALSDCDPSARVAALEGLLENFDDSVKLRETFLKRLVSDLEPCVRLKAIQFAEKLIQMGGSIAEETKAILESRNKDEDDKACREAAEVALGKEEARHVGKNEAEEILVQLLEQLKQPPRLKRTREQPGKISLAAWQLTVNKEKRGPHGWEPHLRLCPVFEY
uniref:HEAT repeat domain-containing protein n=1 Tax=Ascaris lumbricoides TaxID=6252 RepID=A0A9J2P108_ASCLU